MGVHGMRMEWGGMRVEWDGVRVELVDRDIDTNFRNLACSN